MTRKYQDEIDIAVIASKLEAIDKKVDVISIKLDKDYVTIDEFEPVKKVVYGMVTLLLTGVVLALLALVIKE